MTLNSQSQAHHKGKSFTFFTFLMLYNDIVVGHITSSFYVAYYIVPREPMPEAVDVTR